MAISARPTSVPAQVLTPAAPQARRAACVLPRLGSACYGAALLGLAVQCLLRAAPVPGLEPFPASLPHPEAWSQLSGVALGIGGVGALTTAARTPGRRHVAQVLAVGTGALFLVWLLALQLPQLAARPRNGAHWTSTFEVVALAGAAWALSRAPRRPAARSPEEGPAEPTHAPVDLFPAGRVAYGTALLVFGVLHVLYRDFVALLVPAWIPGGLFWAVFTGLAHLAAGLALVSGVRARAGALWVGAMFGSWVLIVHAPRALATPRDPKEWASLLVALGMCGGAWVLAGRLPSGASPDRAHDPAHDCAMTDRAGGHGRAVAAHAAGALRLRRPATRETR